MSAQVTWIPVGDLGKAFAPRSNGLRQSRALVGKQISLHLENGAEVHYHFHGPTELTVQLHGGGQPSRSARASYYAAEIRSGILFVDYIDPTQSGTSISVVLDWDARIGTWLRCQLPNEAAIKKPLIERLKKGTDLAGLQLDFLSAAINVPFTAKTDRHELTNELIGKRVEYTYSATERYEHMYLTDQRYTWHCLEGAEVGLADTDQCQYRKLGDELYLFSWQEKIVPTLGVVVVDLKLRQTCGKVFGYESFAFDAVANFTVGARVTRLIEAVA